MYGQGSCGRNRATTTCAAHSNDRLKNYVGDISQEGFKISVAEIGHPHLSPISIYFCRQRHLATIILELRQTHDGKECAPWRNPRKANSYKRIEDENGNFKRVPGNHCRLKFLLFLNNVVRSQNRPNIPLHWHFQEWSWRSKIDSITEQAMVLHK